MSKRNLFSAIMLPTVALAVTMLAADTSVAQPGNEATRLDQFAHPGGTNYFALSLEPTIAEAPGPRDVVILFDTSASQAGVYRTTAIAALKSALANLSPTDRVRLMAVDLNAAPLTEAFVAPGSPQMADALKKLEARVPLGSTDMEKAITAAAGSFAPNSNNPRAAIYIGDGMSAANLLGTQKFDDLADRLVEQRIPMTSYAVGPRLDRQLLGALAGRSGGLLIDDDENAGAAIAAAAEATVVWPSADAKLPEGMTSYPDRIPPLRSDRDTVVIGTFSGKGPFEIQLDVTGPTGPQSLSWKVQPGPSLDDNAYLTQLVAQVEAGSAVPITGSASLAEAKQAINAGLRDLGQLAQQALDMGNLENAQRLVDGALKRDPNDHVALAVQDAIKSRRQNGAEPAAGGAIAGAPAAEGDIDLGGDADPFAADGAFAEAIGQERRVFAQIMQTQVLNAVNQARAQMDREPEGAIQNLKMTLEKVKQAPDLEPDVRDQLANMIQSALRAGRRRQIEVEQRMQRIHQNNAIAKEQMLINENLLRKQQKVNQLMERFNSLMDEGRYAIAEEEVASEVMTEYPDSPMGVAATLHARTTAYQENGMALRIARQKGVVDVLYETEEAHVPFSGDPPIVYPDAEVWRQLTARRLEKYSSVSLDNQGTAEKKINEALKSPTELDFIETPLRDAVDFLKDRHEIEIQIDTKGLEDLAMTPDEPITKSLKGISLRSALRLMLGDLDLTYVIKDEVLLITTVDKANTELTTKVYPVADLVLPIQSNMMGMGMGGMLGGMTGMGGMGFGGLGGGGMGGGLGGGGFGGGGFGGRGGGMFNMPRDLLPGKIPPGGFRAFSVEDDLSREPAESMADAKQTTETIAVPMEVPAGDTLEGVWEDYFKTYEPTPAAVRQAVRELVDDQHFDEVIVMIQTALRHRQIQPWMYQAMAMAMQADERPKEQIERAVMSAVDFANNAADLMYIGVYLAQLDLDRRALQLFRQTSALAPTWPEPYMHGLKAAQRLDDLEGIQWATLGIIRQAWADDQKQVWKTGLFAAKDTLERLRAEKRTAEADRFQAALDEAIMRDCVVIVSWTGEADVDLLVEEPAGSVCSLRNPRTTSGGVLLGDATSQLGKDSTGGYREIYVCPKGFSGTYRVLVRRVWGELTAGSVNVEVCTNFRSKEAVNKKKRIRMKGDEAVVEFSLADGRRTESLSDHQVANAVNGQLAIGRQIGLAALQPKLGRQVLAQQLAAVADPAAMGSLAGSRGNEGVWLPTRRSAVGYQPVIVSLPEGASLVATAVVSADRRYVRITPNPMFSGIAEVNTFNMATGEGGQGQGGTGGQGFSGGFGGGFGGRGGGGGFGGGGFGGGGMGGGFGGGGLGGGGFGGGGFGGGGLGGGMFNSGGQMRGSWGAF